MNCPRCDATAPTGTLQEFGGVCPKCLLEFAEEQDAPSFPDLDIESLLGQGGMGVVYKARQKHLDRTVALKVLSPQLAADPQFVERFTREAKALAQLNHPNIVGIHEYGVHDGVPFLVMEYVDGTPLRKLLAARKLTPERALEIVPQICEALQYAHSRGVVHRDIKPENVLLDRQGRVKIADFGLAKLASTDETRITRTNVLMGSPNYMAPEQVEKPHAVDHRADIYSLGVVFYEMLTGELPLGRFKAPSEKAAVDRRLDPVVLKSLEKEPDDRYQGAGQVKDEVTRISNDPCVTGAGGGGLTSTAMSAGFPLSLFRLRGWRLLDNSSMDYVALTAFLVALGDALVFRTLIRKDYSWDLFTGVFAAVMMASLGVGGFAVLCGGRVAGRTKDPLRLWRLAGLAAVGSLSLPLFAKQGSDVGGLFSWAVVYSVVTSALALYFYAHAFRTQPAAPPRTPGRVPGAPSLRQVSPLATAALVCLLPGAASFGISIILLLAAGPKSDGDIFAIVGACLLLAAAVLSILALIQIGMSRGTVRGTGRAVTCLVLAVLTVGFGFVRVGASADGPLTSRSRQAGTSFSGAFTLADVWPRDADFPRELPPVLKEEGAEAAWSAGIPPEAFRDAKRIRYLTLKDWQAEIVGIEFKSIAVRKSWQEDSRFRRCATRWNFTLEGGPTVILVRHANSSEGSIAAGQLWGQMRDRAARTVDR